MFITLTSEDTLKARNTDVLIMEIHFLIPSDNFEDGNRVEITKTKLGTFRSTLKNN